MKTTMVLVLAGLLACAGPLQAQSVDTPRAVVLDGDARTGYFQLNRTDRDGSAVTSGDLRTRLRTGVGVRFSDAVNLRVRIAGRFSTDQETTQFYLHSYAPAPDGLRLGQATVDEAYLNIRPGEDWNLRLGRMQTKFSLGDLMGKSLDRADSPNTDITWTDGGHLSYLAPGGWSSHLVLQHNSPIGASNSFRAPLAFADADSRVTIFAGVEDLRQKGPVAQRGIGITYVRDALPEEATGNTRPGDYVAIAGRGSLSWPVGQASTRLLVGGEAGYAPFTPTRASLGLAGADDAHARGVAVQVAASLMDFVPGHRLGLAYGRTQAGWLISPDFRNNDELVEIRYQWIIASGHSVEARVRHREELRPLITAAERRDDLDFYVRYSLKF